MTPALVTPLPLPPTIKLASVPMTMSPATPSPTNHTGAADAAPVLPSILIGYQFIWWGWKHALGISVEHPWGGMIYDWCFACGPFEVRKWAKVPPSTRSLVSTDPDKKKPGTITS